MVEEALAQATQVSPAVPELFNPVYFHVLVSVMTLLIGAVVYILTIKFQNTLLDTKFEHLKESIGERFKVHEDKVETKFQENKRTVEGQFRESSEDRKELRARAEAIALDVRRMDHTLTEFGSTLLMMGQYEQRIAALARTVDELKHGRGFVVEKTLILNEVLPRKD